MRKSIKGPQAEWAAGKYFAERAYMYVRVYVPWNRNRIHNVVVTYTYHIV